MYFQTEIFKNFKAIEMKKNNKSKNKNKISTFTN